MIILTYESQHAMIRGGLQQKVAASDWAGIASDAADLIALESLIQKAPAPQPAAGHATPTVMVHPLP